MAKDIFIQLVELGVVEQLVDKGSSLKQESQEQRLVFSNMRCIRRIPRTAAKIGEGCVGKVLWVEGLLGGN